MSNQNRAGALEDELQRDRRVVGLVPAILFIAKILIAILRTLEEMKDTQDGALD